MSSASAELTVYFKIVSGAENEVKIVNGDKTDVKFLDYIFTGKFVRGAKYFQSHKDVV